ncbi:hypothetical protein PSQ40_03015 [Curvibacter sp. HBC61]|uniref:Uncharacterized protein n=1 Tax=Curvibacter cyanobacteriorum TaxID=3026422 RepID=A0ABT5MU23_9BURK|nr:hypothetical protein [Curvibacter sp. HBC61]MDD0837535.1 hypothetical protein [Curvibacter sp. HBC61]
MRPTSLAAALRRGLQRALLGALALLLAFEEWGWDALSGLLAWIARLPLLAWLERGIRRLPPWAALLTFALPALALLPVKLLALWLFGQGHAAWGLGLLLGAKVLGTAVLAHLFKLTQPALMQLAWFARWYPRWKAWKDQLLTHLRTTAAWRWARGVKARARAWWRRLKR